MACKKKMKYGFGSWLGENAGNIIKTGAGAALTATGVAAPIGIGLMASGATDMAANTLTEDPNAQAALRATGQVAGIAGGAMMGKVGYAMGGNTQLSEINNGGTHEQNPMGGVPMGQAASVEQGETKWEDYIFSDRIKIPGAKHTFADESKKIQKKYPKERENDVPTQKAKKKEMERLMAAQEAIRAEMRLNDESQVAAYGGRIKYPDGNKLLTGKEAQELAKKMLKTSGSLNMEDYNKLTPANKRIVDAAYKSYTKDYSVSEVPFSNSKTPLTNAADSAEFLSGYNRGYDMGNNYPEASKTVLDQGLDPFYGIYGDARSTGYFDNVTKNKKALGGDINTVKNSNKNSSKETELTSEELKWLATIKRGSESAKYVTSSYRKTKGYGTDFGKLTDNQLEQLKNYMTNTDVITDIIEGLTPNTEFFNPKPKNSKLSYGGRIKFPDGGSLVSDKVLSVDSSGILPKTIYDVDKLSPKAKAAYLKNPELFSSSVGIGVAPGAPKMETTIDTNKDAIMKSLNNSKTVSKTPSSIPAPALKWLDEPGITGWQQSKLNNKNVYRRVTMGADGKPTYGPIEYAMGGRIKMNNGGIDPNSFLALNQTLNPNLGNLGQASIPMPNVPIEEEYVAPTIYDTTPVETVKRTFSSDPTSNNNLARTDFSGTEHPSFVEPVPQTAKTTSPTNTTNTTTPNNVPDSDLGNTKQKGASGFDKYDAITMGAQLLPAMYNIGQGLRKQKPVDLGRMTPNLVNYDSSRKASEDSFNQQANILNEGIRENATSSGQALSNRVAFANRAALDKANQLGQINEREYNTNQQIRGNADQVNLQIRANEEQIDAQNKGISQTSVGMGLAQVGQAAGTINRDRNLRLGEKETIGMMGEGLDFEYELIPGTDSYRRIKKGATTNTTTGKK